MCVETNDKHTCTGGNATGQAPPLPSDFLLGDLLALPTNSNEPPSTRRPVEPEDSGRRFPVAAVAGAGAASLAVIVFAVVGALIVKRRRDRTEISELDNSRIPSKGAAGGGPSARPSGSGGQPYAYAQIPGQQISAAAGYNPATFSVHGNLVVGGAVPPSAYASSGHASSPYGASSGAHGRVSCMDGCGACAV
jgi:hypothetical protein